MRLASHAAGVVTVEVSASGGFSTSKVEFAYQPAAVVFSVQPATGPSVGVGVVKIGGAHMVGEALCGFGSSEPSSAHVVSSALVKCEPPPFASLVSFELSIGDDGQIQHQWTRLRIRRGTLGGWN